MCVGNRVGVWRRTNGQPEHFTNYKISKKRRGYNTPSNSNISNTIETVTVQNSGLDWVILSTEVFMGVREIINYLENKTV
jgi:hypothetical protein